MKRGGVLDDTGSSCLFVLNNLNTGGSEQKILRVANGLAKDGWDIHLCALNPPLRLKEQISHNIKFICLNRRGRFDISAIRQLHEYINKKKILHVWGINLYPALYVYIASLLLKHKITIWTSTNTTGYQSFRERLWMFLYIPIVKRSKSIIFGSANQQKQWQTQYRISHEKSIVVYNGVDTNYFSPTIFEDRHEEIRATLGLSPYDIVFGMVAMFRPEKGHDYLVDVIIKLHMENPLIKLLLVGDGPCMLAIQDKVKASECPNAVIFSGIHADVRPMLSIMDVFVLTSTSVETFSNAALEAMSMKLPPILSNISGAPEMIEDGCSGILFEPGNRQALEAAIHQLFDPAKRQNIGEAARQRVVSTFSEQAMINSYKSTMHDY